MTNLASQIGHETERHAHQAEYIHRQDQHYCVRINHRRARLQVNELAVALRVSSFHSFQQHPKTSRMDVHASLIFFFFLKRRPQASTPRRR